MNNFFSDDRKAFFFVLEEFFLVVLIIIQAFFLLGIERQGLNLTFFTKPILFQNILWFVSTILFFITIYFGISIRDKKVLAVHNEFSKLLFGTIKEKVFGLEKEFIVLFFFEFAFAIIIAISIYIYLDPDINLVPWPFNYIVFFAILFFGLYLFSKTKFFRESHYDQSIVRKKILPAERLIRSKLNLNNSSKSIGVDNKFSNGSVRKKNVVKKNNFQTRIIKK